MEKLKLLYQGKTKDVYQIDDGTVLLKFKDDATGKDGKFDPGENTVGLSIEGLGKESLKMSKYFFEKIKEAGIMTHYIDSDLSEATMTVLPAEVFGEGLEFVCRRRAVGSFLKRYGTYVSDGDPLDYLVEVTLKDDDRQDPLITKDCLIMLDIINDEDYEECVDLTKRITKLIYEDLQEKGLELYDIKYEFGKYKGKIMLIDEISAGSMRVYQGKTKVEPLQLAQLVLKT